MEQLNVGKQTRVVPVQRSSIIFHSENSSRKDKTNAKNVTLCNDLRGLGRISSVVDSNASFATRDEVQGVGADVSNPDITSIISPAFVYRVSNEPMCPPALMTGNCSKQYEAKSQSVHTEGENNLDYPSSAQGRTQQPPSSHAFYTEEDGLRKDSPTHSAKPTSSSLSVDTCDQILNPAKGFQEMEGRTTVTKRMSVTDDAAGLKKGRFVDSVVKSVSKKDQSLEDSSTRQENPPNDYCSKMGKDDPYSHEVKRPSTSPLAETTEMEKHLYGDSFVEMKCVNGATNLSKGNAEKCNPTAASMKFFVITDKPGNQILVKAPSWMIPSTVLSLILNSKSTPDKCVSTKEAGEKIKTRSRSGALVPVSWKGKLSRPYRTKGCSTKPKDARERRKEVAKRQRKEEKGHHRAIRSERLHSIKDDKFDNSRKCDGNKRSVLFSNCTKPPSGSGEALSESPRFNHPSTPKLKISLPKMQLTPITSSVAQKIVPTRFELHEGNSNETSLRHSFVKGWPFESSHSAAAAASGLTTDHHNIKKESTSEGSLHRPQSHNGNRIDHHDEEQQQAIDVELQENPEIKIELGGDTRSEEKKERDDLRDETTLESTEIPRDFSLMRSKDRIKILRERMKMREKEIEVLIRNRPKIEEIL